MSKPIFTCMTKATTSEGDNLRRSINWVVSRRAILKVMPDSLICGDWNIPYNEIDEAVLYSIGTIIPGFLLKVKFNNTIFQFGLNWSSFWKKDLPFQVSREKGKLQYSTFSIITRIILVLYIAYLIYKKIKGL